MALQKVHSTVITPTAPFHFDATLFKPDHFTSGDNEWRPGTRWQTMCWQGRRLGLVIADAGTVDDPAVRLDVFSDGDLDRGFVDSLADELSFRFNLDLDLAGFYVEFADDPVVGPVIGRWRGMRPGHPSSLYEYLIIGIVLQNATVRRSMQMFQALLDTYGELLHFDGKRLFCLWPEGSLTGVAESDLRQLKVGYRARSIKRIDDAFVVGTSDEQALRGSDLDTQRRALLELYGVGPATVGYLLMDVFHHWDHFDHVSPWEQKIYTKLFFDGNPEDPVSVQTLLEHIAGYGKYRQLVVHYMWEDLWWKWRQESIPWLEALIRR
jgi:3-methyladenine DNA glycosylase/8-oxoguanine DNA glycosylase